MGIYEYVFFVIIGLIALFFIYQIATKGIKGATFGCKILRTIDRIDMPGIGGMRGHVKIHQLQHKEKNLIGIEVVRKTFASYDMTALSFEKDDIETFIHALQDVVDKINEETDSKQNQVNPNL